MRLGLLVLVGVLVTFSFLIVGQTLIPLRVANAALPNQNQTFTITYQSTSSRVMNYSSGYYDGYYDGSKDGYKSGYRDGYNAGYNYTSAFKDAYKTGYTAGYTDGFNGRQPDITKANQEINQLHLIIESLAVSLIIFIVLCVGLYSHRKTASEKPT